MSKSKSINWLSGIGIPIRRPPRQVIIEEDFGNGMVIRRSLNSFVKSQERFYDEVRMMSLINRLR